MHTSSTLPDGFTRSLWMEIPLPSFSSLRENITCDVCIIGAGIAGMSTAYRLLQEKKKVVIIDDGAIASGETQRTTAHLSYVLGTRYTKLEKLHGLQGARLIAESHLAALRFMQETVAKEGIDCDFLSLDGYLFRSPDSPVEIMREELQAVHRTGMHDVTRLTQTPLDSLRGAPCLRFPQQAQCNPLRYIAGLAQAITAQGGYIFSGTHAEKIDGKNKEVRTAEGYTIHCSSIVVATNAPINDSIQIYTKQAAYRTYAVAFSIAGGSVPKALYWDTHDPYHYCRVASSAAGKDDLLIVGGEDHKTGQANDGSLRFARLEQWTKKYFPEAQEYVYRWSGQVMESSDGIALIGRNPGDCDNVFIATGDSGNGMTHGTIAGLLLTDLICKRENPWEKLYSPSRFTWGSIDEVAKEGLSVAKEYTEIFTAGEVESEHQVKPGQGAIIRQGAKKIALYRDESGFVHTLSAVCPHKGCIVHWNSTEKSWDCPCHGSRYTCDGKVVNGPSNKNLDLVE